MSSPSGSIFVGTFVRDKRQGLGVTYWGSRCKKYVAEYIDDTATCGIMLDLDEELVERPATQQLRDAIAAARLCAGAAAAAAAAAGSAAGAADSPVPDLPELKLVQPNKVSGHQLAVDLMPCGRVVGLTCQEVVQ